MSAAAHANPARTTTASHWPVLAAMSALDRRRVLPVLARDPWAGELAIDNPLLFFLLVRAAGEHALELRKIQLMARMRRGALLALLRCDGSASTERFLRRCGFLRLDLLEHTALMALVTQPLPAWARHWQVPHLGLLTMLRYPSWPYGAAAMQSILSDDWQIRILTNTRITAEHLRGQCPEPLHKLLLELREVERLIDLLDDPALRRRERLALARCHSLTAVQDLHDDLADRDQEHWSHLVATRMAGNTWPPPPVPGNDDIVPIATPEELIAEGYRMHHCIPSYIDDILARRGYVYRVLAPERATLLIGPGRGERWWRREIKLVCNGTAARATRDAVDAWLTETAVATLHQT